jgi:RNA polymerase sigma-70 factor (ECF subfamily)
MDSEVDRIMQYLARVKDGLAALARIHLDRRLWSKIDPEDIVQQTLQEAWAEWESFHGQDEAQRHAWLRRMLLHNVFDAVRHFRRSKCDVALEQALDLSSARLLESLALVESTPSQHAARNEELARLAEALPRLPPDQQAAVILHHLQGLKLAEVAAHLGRSLTAVAGLIHRGLQKLRELLSDEEPHE